MTAPGPLLDVPTREAWRAWLAGHFATALESDPAAWAFFCSTSPSYRRIRVAYVHHARKRPGAYEKRLANLVAKCAAGKQFGYGIEDYY